MHDIFEPTGNWDNHKVLLELALEETKESRFPILELGAGDGSSPCLDAYSERTGRAILRYDFNEEWAKKWNAKLITDWDQVDWHAKHSVALVDESPGEHRHKSLMLLKDTTHIVIVHDSEPAACAGYMLDKVWHYYRYKVDLVSNGAWATAMSNTVDVSRWIGTKKGPYEVRDWNDRNRLAFVCVAFGDERYIEQQKTLKASILKHYPNAPLFFWTNSLPDGSKPFLTSLYGFKPHAVQHAFNSGYRKIAFFDPAMIVNGDFEQHCDELVKGVGVIAVKDSTKLHEVCSEQCATYFGFADKAMLAEKNLVGGSFYYFDFTQERCKAIFNDWMTAEIHGIFGSQHDAASGVITSHRYDETVMAICMWRHGAEPMENTVVDYCVKEDSLLTKKHFK